MNAEQFAWAHLISNGMAFIERSYYGGYKLSDYAGDALDAKAITISDVEFFEKNQWADIDKAINHFNQLCLKLIKTHGIDWVKSGKVKSDFASEFNGTFAKATRIELLVGILVLKNGLEMDYSCESLVGNVFEHMANIDKLSNFYQENLL